MERNDDSQCVVCFASFALGDEKLRGFSTGYKNLSCPFVATARVSIVA